MVQDPRLHEWRHSLLLTATHWSAVFGFVIAALVGLRELQIPSATSATPLVVMYGGYAAIVMLRFVPRWPYRFRAAGLCAAFAVTAAGAILLRGLAPGPVLLLSLCVLVAGLTLGRAALVACLALTAGMALALDTPQAIDVGDRVVHAVGYVCATAALAEVVMFVVARLESTVGETSSALERLETEQALRERAQQALARAQDALYQTQKLDAVGRLAGGVAHDFNNTLQVVIGWCALLEDTTDPVEMREGLGQIRAAAEGSSRLTRQLLVFSRPGVSESDYVALDELLQSLATSYRRLLPDDISLRIEVAPGLGLAIDRSQFTQVLLNLVLNARDAMPGGGVLVLQARSCRHAELPPAAAVAIVGDAIEIVVADNGTGMDEAISARAFEPFFTTKGDRGTGLGLPTVYGVIHQAHGAVTIDSAPGTGTSVRLFLPTAAPPPEGVPDDAAAQAESAPATAQYVLLAEDERGVRSSLALALRRSGRAVVEASDVPQALRALAEEGGRFDVLVTDGIMPGGSTREVIDDFLRRRPDGRVVVCSGYVDNELAGRDLGGVSFELFLKPFAPSDLVSRLDGRRPDVRPVRGV